MVDVEFADEVLLGALIAAEATDDLDMDDEELIADAGYHPDEAIDFIADLEFATVVFVEDVQD